jgi:hypothetical protein
VVVGRQRRRRGGVHGGSRFHYVDFPVDSY